MTQEELQIISNRDTHWDEVIKLCRKYGFVTQEYGNSVTLMTNSYQLDSWHEPAYRFRQEQMFGSFPQPGGELWAKIKSTIRLATNFIDYNQQNKH